MLTSCSLIATLTDQPLSNTLDMLGLPLEVYNHLREFVLPIPYDWRTRRAHEAELIRDELIWRRETRAIAQRGRTVEEAEEVRTWTLYGILISDNLDFRGHPPRIPPSDAAYQDNPRAWYRHRLYWVSDGGE